MRELFEILIVIGIVVAVCIATPHCVDVGCRLKLGEKAKVCEAINTTLKERGYK